MCGIAGYIIKSQPNSKLRSEDTYYSDLLIKSKSLLSHRGPDDFGFFNDNLTGVGLTHTRLSILDLSPAGHQPMISDNGKLLLVFNGEIYNFKQLKAELDAETNISWKSNSDTEILLQLYARWRHHEGFPTVMLNRLNGIFSFAVWDSESGQLFIARDAFGIKPLYYADLSDCFVFASEIKALIPFMPKKDKSFLDNQTSIHPDLDLVSIDRYASFLWCPGEGTPSIHVRKLGPGEAIKVSSSGILNHCKWYSLPVFRTRVYSRTPKFGSNQNQSMLLDLNDSIQGTVHHLRNAVHRQMVSDVPVGAFLSGGLDSSSIVTFAREINPDIRCFTIDIPTSGENGMTNDLPYACKVADHLKVQLETIRVDPLKMANGLEEMIWQLDEPLADPAPLNVLFISKLARDSGIKVLLSGAGGDDIFSGYRRHEALIRESWWNWLPFSIRSKIRDLTDGFPVNHALSRRIRKVFSGADLEGDERLVHYFRWIGRADICGLYSKDFRAILGETRAEEPMLQFLSHLPVNTPPLDKMLALEQRFFLTDHNLVYTDKMSMQVGVEVRVPFLDLDLVDFVSRIPRNLKQNGRQGKWVLKKAMEPFIPRDVIYRKKTGFGMPLRRWLRVELHEWLIDILSESSLKNRGLFDPKAVKRLIEANTEGRIDASYTLFSLACIEIWCRRFMDNTTNMIL
jgi:asparagine synthase (glutamine-hydrolysing)